MTSPQPGQVWRCEQPQHRSDRLVLEAPRGAFVRMKIVRSRHGSARGRSTPRGRIVRVPLSDLASKYVLVGGAAR